MSLNGYCIYDVRLKICEKATQKTLTHFLTIVKYRNVKEIQDYAHTD